MTPSALLAGRHGRRGSRAAWLPTLPLPAAVPALQPMQGSPAPDLPWRPAAGDCLMGVQLGLMGVQLGFHGHLGRLARPRRRCGKCRAAAEGRHCAFLMNKRSEAAAAVRPDPAAPFRLTILAGSAAHRAGLVRRAGDATSFRPWIAAQPALFVLAWHGDRSPIRGCTTTGRDRVPLGHSNSP